MVPSKKWSVEAPSSRKSLVAALTTETLADLFSLWRMLSVIGMHRRCGAAHEAVRPLFSCVLLQKAASVAPSAYRWSGIVQAGLSWWPVRFVPGRGMTLICQVAIIHHVYAVSALKQ